MAVDFNWCKTHHTQKSKHISYFKVCHGSGRPTIFRGRVKSHLPFAGIIKSSPYTPR